MRFTLSLLPWLFTLAACQPFPAWPNQELKGMVIVPAGWFLMGEDAGRMSNRPRHWVYLDAFAIDRTEVTRGSYRKFLVELGFVARAADGAAEAARDDRLPAVGITWKNASAYCSRAGKRLPTEAEWEKAARGADAWRYPWGERWDEHLANTAESGHGAAVPVGSYPAGASRYGALDMAGNAAEWVADFYDPAYYTRATNWNPPGPQMVLDHVLRGGSWDSSPQQVTTFFRDSSHSARPNLRVGFRCARSLETHEE